jgi:hypothetical protein
MTSGEDTASPPARRYVPEAGVIACLLFFVALGLFLAGAVVQAWPVTASPSPAPIPSPATPAQSFAPTSLYGVVNLPTAPDGRLLTLVALAGAIGATIYSLRSFAMFAGNRTLVTSWLSLYFAMPVVGALLGQVFYFVIRAGLLSSNGTGAEVNPYGFTAAAGLGGLFASQALEKLKQVFEVIFTGVPGNSDPMVPPAPPVIADLKPRSGPVGSTIAVTGTGLARVRSVAFAGPQPDAPVKAQPPADVSDASLTVKVPEGAQSGPITVTTAGGASATSTIPFTVSTNEPE